MLRARTFAIIAAALAVPQVASAQGASVGGAATVEGPAASGNTTAAAEPAAPAASPNEASGADPNTKWIKRFAPERNTVELGVFGGVFVFNKYHDFYDPNTAPQEMLRRPAPDLGARIGYYPLRVFGIEAEFSAVPSRYMAGTGAGAGPGGSAFIYGVRAHGILQLPLRVTPFFAGGYGIMGVSSSNTVAGKDIDPVGHLGGGVKFFVNRYLLLRLDLRNYIAAQAAEQVDGTGHFQATLGLSLVLGRKKDKPAAKEDPDRDKDGFLNNVDKCPDTPGIAPDGCPDKDSDGDGFYDSVDKCPTVPGVAPHGCPPSDRDKDGFLDEVDACPDEPGVAPDGCPLRDTDGDGILDKDDKCVTEPETRNGLGGHGRLPRRDAEGDHQVHRGDQGHLLRLQQGDDQEELGADARRGGQDLQGVPGPQGRGLGPHRRCRDPRVQRRPGPAARRLGQAVPGRPQGRGGGPHQDPRRRSGRADRRQHEGGRSREEPPHRVQDPDRQPVAAVRW
jgi:hypothetical protein